MFVRVKVTPNSPRKSVQIVASLRVGDKVRQKIVRYIGVAQNDEELEELKLLAESIKIQMEAGSQQLLMSPEKLARINLEAKAEKYASEDYQVDLRNLVEEQRIVSGIHDAYGALFSELGYDRVISNPKRNVSAASLFKDLVLARIANPASKMASRDMLEEDFGISLPLDKIYRMMDKLDHKAIQRLKEITYQNTLNLLGGKISVIFYDVTTLYFESFDSDELKKCGFSKDSKHNQPQVLLALMVTAEGLPLDYEVFPGNIYEGKTLIPALEKISQKYNIEEVILVADSAMLSEDNILKLDSLKEKNISYIVGARLKSLPAVLKKKILDPENYPELEPGYLVACFNYKGKKLVVSYSSRRAKKDEQDRIKALEKLEAKLQKSKNPKSHLSNAGYRKYLKLEGESKIVLDEDKIALDRAWDGLLGVITNSEMSPPEILSKYSDLFTVEDSFRLTKHDLKIRPIFHWKPRRVRAHIALCFTAYVLVKHMEHRVRLQYRKLSPEKIRQALVRVQTSILFDKVKRIRYGLPSRLSHDARKIYDLLKVKKTITPYIIKKL
ncbi:hypothetical protein HKBW3S25_00495 [Candidatus Hakubella thermalkaliphila]|uniref:Transposase IS4-like domain-containing protein n=1 Tax=Candidatus Hakubella thermalkaliphila TaxID=2754717 RepID=A0A6V8NXR3_9ACTN|nr:hypothetical protein HKBW3S25_00495 [Candidatus Hakubella thermalkaliphila]